MQEGWEENSTKLDSVGACRMAAELRQVSRQARDTITCTVHRKSVADAQMDSSPQIIGSDLTAANGFGNLC